jgi:thiol:disulfide interchange protein DsbD
MFRIIAFLLILIIQNSQGNELLTNNSSNHFGGTELFANSKIISADQAFKFIATRIADKINVDVIIAPNCYLYKDKLQLINATNQQQKIIATYPKPRLITDEFTQKNIAIYDTSFTINIIDSNIKSLIVNYQGCYADTLCYPPQSTAIDIPEAYTKNAALILSPPATTKTVNDSSYFDILTTSSFIVNLLIFFFAGIALCFTPCVFPMLPIICSVLINNATTNWRQSLQLACLYVIGMSLVMTAMGIITAILGSSFNLQLHMQSPWLLIPMAILFILLAVSMFGIYEIKLPAKLQQKLERKPKSTNKHLYAFFMGVIAALVVSPCVTPPLVGALLYISSTADIILGGCCLFALGLGMGLPMIIISIGGKSLLPKSGAWMLAIRIFFAIALMLVADMLLARTIQQQASYLIHIFIAILSIILLYKCLLPYCSQKFARWLKLSSYSATCLGIIVSLIIVSKLIVTQDNQIASNTSKQITITSPVKLTNSLNKFKQQRLPVMLFINANWCSLCHTMENDFTNNDKVILLMQNLAYINFDITKLTPQQHGLLKSLNIFGPPAILFFDANGNEITDLRINHAVTADNIADRIQTMLNK